MKDDEFERVGKENLRIYRNMQEYEPENDRIWLLIVGALRPVWPRIKARLYRNMRKAWGWIGWISFILLILLALLFGLTYNPVVQ